MTHRYTKNGARQWCWRLLATLSLLGAAAVAAAVLSPPIARLARSLVAAPPLNAALNLIVLAAFAIALAVTFAWLARAAREEAAVNQAFGQFFAAPPVAKGAARPGEARDPGRLPASAVRERMELLQGLRRPPTAADAAALAESLAEREESRTAVARHAAGTLVLLGLLGTFVGLLVTIAGVTDVVGGLALSPAEDLQAFLARLQAGLQAPLAGMALAFSTSLVGLTGSLVIGAGALGLAAAQASWIGKLEELTSMHLVTAPAAVTPGVGSQFLSGAPPVAGLEAAAARVESAAHRLAAAHDRGGEHVARLDVASARLAGAVEGLRERVAFLAGQNERQEAVMARVADAQLAGRESLNDLGIKAADLAGTAAAIAAEIRDGRLEVSEQVHLAGRGLREGLTAGLGGLATALVDAGEAAGTAARIDALQATLQEASRQRAAEAEALRAQLAELRAGLAAGSRPPPAPPAARPLESIGLPLGRGRP